MAPFLQCCETPPKIKARRQNPARDGNHEQLRVAGIGHGGKSPRAIWTLPSATPMFKRDSRQTGKSGLLPVLLCEEEFVRRQPHPACALKDPQLPPPTPKGHRVLL